MARDLQEFEASWRAAPEDRKALRALARAYSASGRAEEAYDLLYDHEALRPRAAWVNDLLATLKAREMKALKRRLGAAVRFAAFLGAAPSSPQLEQDWDWRSREDFQEEPYPARALTVFNSKKVLKALLKSLVDFPALRDVTFRGCAGLVDQDLAALAPLPRLRSLNLSFNKDITDAGLVGLEAPRDFKLMFCDNIRGPGLAHLRSVRSIDLMKTPVSDEGLAHLSGATSIRLGDCPNVRGASFDQLRAVCSLTSFRLPLEPEAFRALAELPLLEELRLSATYKLRGEDLAPLAGSASLRRLELALCYEVNDDHVAALAGAPVLEELDLSQTSVTAKVLDILKAFPKLRRVKLEENSIDPEAIARLEAALKRRGS